MRRNGMKEWGMPIFKGMGGREGGKQPLKIYEKSWPETERR